MKKLSNKIAMWLALLIMGTSCSTDDLQVDRNIEIVNDEVQLSARLIEENKSITIVSDSLGKKVKDIKLTLKARLIPPSVNGNQLQATSIVRSGNIFAVSYNYAGEVYHGGIDLIDGKVKLKSEIQFSDADINDLVLYKNELFFVGGTSSLEQPAFVEKISIKKGKFSLDGNVRVNVGSYMANSITNSGSDIYVTSGNDETIGGGLYQLSTELSQLNYQQIKDARWVTSQDGNIYCLSGNPSRVHVFNETLSSQGEFSHSGISHPEAKMTVDIADDLVFVAGGDKGLLVYELDGTLASELTFNDNSVTNAVTADNGYVFISNGEGGVYVASYKDEISMIGKLALDNHESVNHILLRGNTLYVASGLGGVKMIEIK